MHARLWASSDAEDGRLGDGAVVIVGRIVGDLEMSE
jgi:hypothetical protein